MRLRFASTLVLSALLASVPALTQGKPPQPAPSCGQRGRVLFDKDTTLIDANGRKLARFSGGESAVTLLAATDRRQRLGSDRDGYRPRFVSIERFREGERAPHLHQRRSAGCERSRVARRWHARHGRRLERLGKVRVDKQVSTPFNQRFSATTECSTLTFTPPTPPAFSMPGSARVFLMKVALLDLYDDMPPTGAPVTTLQRSPQRR